METKDIIILVACLLLVGFSLYRKYVKKKETDNSRSAGKEAGHIPDTRDDDYEPYSGR